MPACPGRCLWCPPVAVLQMPQQPVRQDGVIFGALLRGHGFNDLSDLLAVALCARLGQFQEQVCPCHG